MRPALRQLISRSVVLAAALGVLGPAGSMAADGAPRSTSIQVRTGKAATPALVAPADLVAVARASSSTATAASRSAFSAVTSPDSTLAWVEAHAVAAPLRAALERSGVESQDYGLVVRPVDGNGIAFEHNAHIPFNPASTMKLVTTHAAIGLLGSDYRWITGIYATGLIEEGVLKGDLIIKGGGDPKLVIEDMTELVAKLRGSGLRDIRGDLVIDDSIYGVGPERQPSFDGDDARPYNVEPYAALMNFKATRFTVNPRNRTVVLDPPLADVKIDNQVRVLKGRCRRGVTGFAIEDAGTESRPVIRVSGTMVGACGEQQIFAATLSHRQYVHGFFKAAWTAAGGTLAGSTRIVRGAARGEPYFEWHSPRTLADIVRDINKFSNNVMARMLVLQMGAASGQRSASVDDGRDTLRDWYASRKLALPSLVIENGSGLSRNERISAADLTAILVDAQTGPNAWMFEDSLPSVGVDGTMRNRLRRDPVVGNAHIKTGTLRNVRAIAGYVTAASGTKYALTLIVNGPRAEGSGQAQDVLVRWLYQNG